MTRAISDKELTTRAIDAVASQFRYKGDGARAHAVSLIAKEPQLWAAPISEQDLRNDGFKATLQRKDAIWRALGGAA